MCLMLEDREEVSSGNPYWTGCVLASLIALAVGYKILMWLSTQTS